MKLDQSRFSDFGTTSAAHWDAIEEGLDTSLALPDAGPALLESPRGCPRASVGATGNPYETQGEWAAAEGIAAYSR